MLFLFSFERGFNKNVIELNLESSVWLQFDSRVSFSCENKVMNM